jgi:serine/threonine-protein kinase
MSSNVQPTAPELLRFQAALAGRYSIERELGRGGMGIVLLAREVALDRLVALKLLPPALAAQEGVKERFLREARTAARLSHPNIVQIYAVDEVDDFVFFAMAFVDGGTLGDRIRARGPLSNSQATRMLREVAWALGHAHLQGVVHRDVKPDNILLDMESGRAMVTDFGIAVAAVDAVGPADPGGEGGAQVLGTAEFISPEQAKGAPVDARSDLYSLACVGFYALSGTVPFTDASSAAILVQHVTATPPTVLSAAPHAPTLVAAALDRCLRKDPEQRFETGNAFADALGAQQEVGEMALPLRVFLKQSREWETTLAYTLLALSFAIPGLVASAFPGVPFLATAVMVAVVLALLGVPVLALARIARRLLSSGFTQADATVAFLRDIDHKEEEYRFEVGERVTLLDKAFRVLKLGGFALSPVLLAWALAMRSDPLAMASMFSFDAGILGTIFQELRARSRGDVVGERFLRLWKSKFGTKLFQMGGMGLERVAPAVSSGIHRATEVVLGLEADRLFEALPKEDKKKLDGLPSTVQALERDAQALRKKVGELETILAEIGDDDPSRPSARERARVRNDVEATRSAAQERLRKVVAALETIRLGLLYMQAGSRSVDSLTVELKVARDLSEDMENLLAGHREVERILRERRQTGVFRLVEEATPRRPDDGG